MYACAEDKAIHELAQAVLLLIQLLRQGNLNLSDEDQKVLDKASGLARSSIQLVR